MEILEEGNHQVVTPPAVCLAPNHTPRTNQWPTPPNQPRKIDILKGSISSHGGSLATLENCCMNRVTTMSSLKDHFENMNINLNKKIEALQESVEQLCNSLSHHTSKHRTTMDFLLFFIMDNYPLPKPNNTSCYHPTNHEGEHSSTETVYALKKPSLNSTRWRGQ